MHGYSFIGGNFVSEKVLLLYKVSTINFCHVKKLIYSKSCVNGHSKIDKTKILMTFSILNEGQKYCRMFDLEHSAILLTCIKQ